MTDNRHVPWWQGWLPLSVLPMLVAVLVPDDSPRWLLMWLLSFTIYFGVKWLTWRRSPAPTTPLWQHLAYLLLWPGLDARAFLSSCSCSPLPGTPGRGAGGEGRPTVWEWLFAASKLTIGVILIFVVARLLPSRFPYLIGWVGMIGIVMVLHFGVFHLLSCWWRSFGLDARPLMDWPIAARSVSEFWGRRWNTAFRDLTHRFLFRPLTARLGARGALFVGFVFSGLVHDVVITIPAGGGYGGPTLFFLVQAGAIFVERSKLGRGFGLGRGRRGWLFTMIVLAGPVWLLFPPPFVEGIVTPFLAAMGAL